MYVLVITLYCKYKLEMYKWRENIDSPVATCFTLKCLTKEKRTCPPSDLLGRTQTHVLLRCAEPAPTGEWGECLRVSLGLDFMSQEAEATI